MMPAMQRRERPARRTNPSGKTVWLARWTDKTGKRRYGWPPEIRGTYELKRDAQDAIDACYELDKTGPVRRATIGSYFETWTQIHPRAPITDKTNRYRVRAVLDVKVEGAPLRDWPFERLRRRHANLLVDHMLREQGRAYTGARHVIGALSAMTEDAIEDEVATTNPFRGVKIRANDPRVQKGRRPIRVWSWQQMHEFAAACAISDVLEPTGPGSNQTRAANEWRSTLAEPMIRTLADCGLRVGELFAIPRSALNLTDALLEVRQSVSGGVIVPGTKTDHGERDAGRVAPIPPALCEMLKAMPKRIDSQLLFPAPLGGLWDYATWWRIVWHPARDRAGIDPRPNEFRHSYVSLMRAARIDPADLAAICGHSEHTATARYTHSLGRSFDVVRNAVGG
jgi:integrase